MSATQRTADELEAACDFAGAARAALAEKDPGRAVRLAALADDRGFLAEAIDALLDEASERDVLLVAEDVFAKGHGYPAGLLFESAGKLERAGTAFAAGGAPLQAALAFERGGRPADGAKVLERALRDDPSDERIRLGLARLLSRHGRVEACVKTLQQVAVGAPERKLALPLLARSLRAMGLSEAAAEVEREMETIGVSVDDGGDAGAPASEATPEGKVLFGRYEVLRDVAHTPHARLFEARDLVSGRRVAVKVLVMGEQGSGRDAYQRFEREARALRMLKHANIVALHAYVPSGPALVMEWMDGGSIVDLLAAPIAPARALEIAASTLSALGEAHRIGILHRDVKPSNVMLDGIGTPRLGDFGAAHLSDLSTTATAGAIGTFAYMSPEQRLGKPATTRSDVYAVGALLYEMITGAAATPVRDAALSPAPSECHLDLDTRHDQAVARLLADDPEKRPEGAFEARRMLETIPWSNRVLPRPERVHGPRSSRPPPAPGADRLAPSTLGDVTASHLALDTWFGRHVFVVPLDADALAFARATARVRHPSLAAVLRASTEESAIWFEYTGGRRLGRGGVLSGLGFHALREGLDALHAAGIHHGCVDDEHVHLTAFGVYLAPPRVRAPGSPAGDLASLEALYRRAPAAG